MNPEKKVVLWEKDFSSFERERPEQIHGEMI